MTRTGKWLAPGRRFSGLPEGYETAGGDSWPSNVKASRDQGDHVVAVAICVGELVGGCLLFYVLLRRWAARVEFYRIPAEQRPKARRRAFRMALAVCWTAVVVGSVTALIINLRS
jgi:hypothetical protein